MIDVPFTVITEDSSYVISEYLNYARRDDSIKAVVIKITSPGGGAAASERLYRETGKLREEKPVVLVMNGLVASGGYMMAMGATHSYAQTSSLVGNVGVVSFSEPLIPPLPDESVLATGPYKLSGFSRGEWFGIIEDLKEAFAQIVVSERGDKLRISQDELVQGRLYSGMHAVRLGLVDELGGDSDALEKAAELSGISNYGLVDVNLEVLRQYVKDLEGILPSLGGGNHSADAMALLGREYRGNDPALQYEGIEPQQQPGKTGGPARADSVRQAGNETGRPPAGVPFGNEPPQRLLPVRGQCSLDWRYLLCCPSLPQRLFWWPLFLFYRGAMTRLPRRTCPLSR